MDENKIKIKKDLFRRIRTLKGNSKNRGITLIALIITIIILLILAGLTISQLSNSGLFDKTKIAKEKYQNAQQKEEIELSKYNDFIDNYTINADRNTKVDDYRENLICEFNMANISNNGLTDASGNENMANITGTGYEIKTENGRKFLRLSGSTYVQTSQLTTLAANAPKTIMCCFRTNDSSSDMVIILGDDDERNGGFPIRIQSGYAYFATGYNVYRYGAQTHYVADNKWHFACLTFDSKTLVFYIDNQPIYATDATLETGNTSFTIAGNKQGNKNFKGDISDVRVYDKGLNFEEIYRIYQNVKR